MICVWLLGNSFIAYVLALVFGILLILVFHRDALEATGEEPDDTDFDMPKVYEPV